MRRKSNTLNDAIRPLTAWEALSCIRDAAELARELGSGEDARSVCFNACLAARCLYQNGKRPFDGGREALSALSLAQLAEVAEHYAALFGAGKDGNAWGDSVSGLAFEEEEE